MRRLLCGWSVRAASHRVLLVVGYTNDDKESSNKEGTLRKLIALLYS
jgi:hypothetical protein